jgi:hypothetical protein
MTEESIAAPMPQRPAAHPAPAVVNAVQSPAPAAPTWNENMPIVFGGQNAAGASKPSASSPNAGAGTWDAGQGIKFGQR